MRFSLAISHAPWLEGRAASMKRLTDSLVIPRLAEAEELSNFEIFCDKEPNHVWSFKMWQWAASQEVDWCVFLQDDAIVAPEFFERLEQVIDDSPSGIIGLQVPHPAAGALALEGCAGFTTTDGLVGVGYAIKRSTLAAFLSWRINCLNDGAVRAISEDSLVGLYAAVTGELVYHPIPALVDHDTTIESAYGNDSHANRKSRVRWDTEGLPPQKHGVSALHLGCFYASTPAQVKQWVKDAGPDLVASLARDDGRRVLVRLNYARKARGTASTARVFIATPVRDGLHANYVASLWLMMRDEEIDVSGSIEIEGAQMRDYDLVRVRSNWVTHFLRNTDATHLLFLDADIEVQPCVLRGMLSANRDFVAAPYPRRQGVNFARSRKFKEAGLSDEAGAYDYPLRKLDGALVVDGQGCAEVEGVPLGCALLSRTGLERMAAFYAGDALAFDDPESGPSLALFQLLIHNRALLSEDFSFCHRWREMGDKVYMFLGNGSPVTHHGAMRYQGDLGAFGLRRV